MADITNHLLYDKECPFCSSYINLLKLRETVGELDLLDARNNHDYVIKYRSMGLEINDGMILFLDGTTYFGDDAIHTLALLTSDNGFFNKVNKFIFKRKALAKKFYPLLVLGRKLYFALIGKSWIE